MIYSSFEGRIGNNLFQIAACLSLANHVKTEACGGSAGNLKYIKENFILENFNFIDVGDPSGFVYRKKLPKEINNIYYEKYYQFDKDFFLIPDNTFLDGYFQSEKYFKSVEELIRKNFTFKEHIIDYVKNLDYFIPHEQKTGFIHIRRGDYTQPSNILCYPPLSSEYYFSCINNSGIDNVYVFSDDIEWCIENFKINHKKIIYVKEKDPYISLYMMSKINVAIISNSTYSWWGAWLNNFKNKIVYYPKIWYGEHITRKFNMSPEEYIIDLPCADWIGV